MRCLAAMAVMFAAAAQAGHSSGFDPAAIDQCLADAPDAICADAGMEACRAYVQDNHPDVAPVDRDLGCVDASRQAWDAHLGRVYDRVVGLSAAQDADTEQALRQMERDWITFRDARCAFDRLAFGGGTGGAVEQPRCLRDETARHAALLSRYATELEP